MKRRLVSFGWLAISLGILLGAPILTTAQIQVNSASPSAAPQGTTNLNVGISGSGFKKGAKAQWFVTGTTNPGGVTVNSTTFNNSGQVTANITIASDAVISGFDIAVTNTDGRTGKGTDKFAVLNSAAANHGCADIPISFTFLATTVAPAAISNDTSGTPYQGLSNTVIHICSGTNDATMVLAHSSRSVSIQFPEPIPGSIIVAGPPSFAGGPAFQSQPFFNVRNVLNSGKITATSPATDFYTRMVVNYLDAPDGHSYGLRYHPDDSACPLGILPCAPDLDAPTIADMNQPVETSWLLVHFMPAPNPSQPWSPSNAAKWLVDGEQLDTASGLYQRGTLHIKTKSGGDGAHQGQYAMPFQILITALGPI